VPFVLALDLSSLFFVRHWFSSDPVVIFAWAQTPESFPARSLSAPTDSFFVRAPDGGLDFSLPDFIAVRHLTRSRSSSDPFQFSMAQELGLVFGAKDGAVISQLHFWSGRQFGLSPVLFTALLHLLVFPFTRSLPTRFSLPRRSLPATSAFGLLCSFQFLPPVLTWLVFLLPPILDPAGLREPNQFQRFSASPWVLCSWLLACSPPWSSFVLYFLSCGVLWLGFASCSPGFHS
jgi:hypothetical protein